jgi:hypothetical protein
MCVVFNVGLGSQVGCPAAADVLKDKKQLKKKAFGSKNVTEN